MPKIVYKAALGPSHDKFGLRETKPSGAILIADNESSDFSLKSLSAEPSLLEPKQIFEIQNLTNTTHILSNTSDILVTDQVEDGKPLYYKVRRKSDLFDTAFINGVQHKMMDSNFIYTAMSDGEVQYKNEEDEIVFSEKGEFFPVFIWEGMVHLQDIMDLDKRTLSYSSSSKNRMLIKCSRGRLIAEANSGSIFDLINESGLTFKMKSFIYSDTKTIAGKRVEYHYDYSKILPNVKTVSQDQALMLDREYLQLSNKNIIKDSFSLTVVDPEGLSGDVIYEVNSNSSLTSLSVADGSFHPANINSTDGRVSIEHILKEYDIDPVEYIFVASYSFVEFKDNEVTVKPEAIDLKYRKAIFSVNPTRIIQEDSSVDYTPSISYTIFDPNGSITTSIDKNIPLYDFKLTIKRGWGEDAYSEHGYSGVTDEITDEAAIDSKIIVADANDTGWGEGAFNEGPFGGSYIRNIDDIRKFLEARENSVVGNISVGEIDFTPTVAASSIFGVKRLARPKHSPVEELHIYSGGLWHQSVNGEYSECEVAAGVHEYRSTGGIFVHGDIISSTDSVMTLEFDTSALAEVMTPEGSIGSDYVTSNIEVLEAASVYSRNLKDFSLSVDSLKLFERKVDGSVLAIDGVLSYTFVNDLTRLIVSIPAALSGATVGLGISNSTDHIYPTAFFKI